MQKCVSGKLAVLMEVKLEKHPKAVTKGDLDKFGMADHICWMLSKHYSLWDRIQITDTENIVVE